MTSGWADADFFSSHTGSTDLAPNPSTTSSLRDCRYVYPPSTSSGNIANKCVLIARDGRKTWWKTAWKTTSTVAPWLLEDRFSLRSHVSNTRSWCRHRHMQLMFMCTHIRIHACTPVGTHTYPRTMSILGTVS